MLAEKREDAASVRRQELRVLATAHRIALLLAVLVHLVLGPPTLHAAERVVIDTGLLRRLLAQGGERGNGLVVGRWHLADDGVYESPDESE